MDRNQFAFYASYFEAIENLRTYKEKAQAYGAICRYALSGKFPEQGSLSLGASTVFMMAHPALVRGRVKAKAGKIGGCAVKAQTDLPAKQDKE